MTDSTYRKRGPRILVFDGRMTGLMSLEEESPFGRPDAAALDRDHRKLLPLERLFNEIEVATGCGDGRLGRFASEGAEELAERL